jgi:hypothetical protein
LIHSDKSSSGEYKGINVLSLINTNQTNTILQIKIKLLKKDLIGSKRIIVDEILIRKDIN